MINIYSIMIEEREGKCSEHPQMDLSFVCLDSGCTGKALVCVICLKNEHHLCPDETVICRKDLGKVTKNFGELEEVKIQLLKTFKEFAEKVSKETEEFGLSMEKAFEIGVLSAETPEEDLSSLRQFLRFSRSEDRSVSLQMMNGGQKIDEKFAEDVETTLKEFLQVSREAFQLNLSFRVNSFLFHKQILINRTSNGGLSFKIREDSDSSYYTAISKHGQRKGSMKMKVDWVPDYGRYIEFGIMKAETALEDVPKNNFITSQTDQRAWTYSGCYISQVEGQGVSSDEDDPAGLAVGKEYLLEFDAEKGTVSFNGDNENVRLNGQIPDADYVFYIVFYYPLTAMTAYFT